MEGMSRMHDALGHRKAPQEPSAAGQWLGQLGWAQSSRTTRRRQSPGQGNYLLWGILIGGLVWIGWWLVTSRDQSTTAELAAGQDAVRVERADAPVEPGALVDTPSVAGGELLPDEPAATAGSGDTMATRLDDGLAASVPSLPVISAILLSEGRRLAVIDGRVLAVGQRLEPWELVSVDKDAVVLRDPSGVEQVVTLDQE